MNIKTKFNLGQRVFALSGFGKQHVKVACPDCKGIGKLTFVETGRRAVCPTCYGNARVWTETKEFQHTTVESVIGKIKYEQYFDGELDSMAPSDRGTCEIQYMLDKTGIGSGAMYQESKIFASRAELDAEIERLKKEYEDD